MSELIHKNDAVDICEDFAHSGEVEYPGEFYAAKTLEEVKARFGVYGHFKGEEE